MGGFEDAFLGYFVSETSGAIRKQLKRLIGEPEQRAFDRIIRESILPAVRRAAPQSPDRAAIVSVIEMHKPSSFDNAIEDLLDPLEAVHRWLAPLFAPQMNARSYFDELGFDGNILCEALAIEIIEGLKIQVRTGGPLQAVAEEIRWAHLDRYLRQITVSLEALLERAEISRRMPHRPFMVPPKLSPVVQRPELQEESVSALLQGRFDGVMMGTALKGTGGFGKTTIAEEICRDPRMSNSFPGGVLWTTMGPDRGATHIAGRVNHLSWEINRQRPSYTDPERAIRHLQDLLDDRPTLLVVDDVWTSLQSQLLSFHAPSLARLFTTRVAPSVPRGFQPILVDAMSEPESLELLNIGLGEVESSIAEVILRMTGGWPVLIALVNGQARRLAAAGNDSTHAMRAIANQLLELGPAALDITQAEQREYAVSKTIDASLRHLGEQDTSDLERYLMLASFPRDYDIPLTRLASYWMVSESKAGQICMSFDDLSLVQRYRVHPKDIRLHDVVQSYLVRLAGPERLRAWSQRLLEDS